MPVSKIRRIAQPISKAMPPTVSPNSNVQFLQQLAAIQKQQEASSQSIELLKAQHHQWQKSVDALLAEIRQGINSTEPLQRPGGDRAEALVDLESVKSVNSANDFVALEAAPFAEVVETNQTNQTNQTNHMESPQKAREQQEAQELADDFELPVRNNSQQLTRRAGTLDELFRTRKTVVGSNQPAGLGKLVQEELNVSENSGRDERSTDRIQRIRSAMKKVVASQWFEQLGKLQRPMAFQQPSISMSLYLVVPSINTKYRGCPVPHQKFHAPCILNGSCSQMKPTLSHYMSLLILMNAWGLEPPVQQSYGGLPSKLVNVKTEMLRTCRIVLVIPIDLCSCLNLSNFSLLLWLFVVDVVAARYLNWPCSNEAFAVHVLVKSAVLVGVEIVV